MFSLAEIAKAIRPIVVSAVEELGPDLQGYSVIDLCYDQLPAELHCSTSDIKSALVVAGVDSLLSRRLILSYSR